MIKLDLITYESLAKTSLNPSEKNLRDLRDRLLYDLRMEQCSTSCDYDCLDICHESHQIFRRRVHNVDECECRRGLTND